MSAFSVFESMFRAEQPSSYDFIVAMSAQLQQLAELADVRADIPQALFDELDVAHLNVALVPCNYGGRDSFGSLRRRLIVNYWLGKGDPALAIALPGPSLASPPLCMLANPRQKQEFFRPFIESSVPRWAAFALTEAHGGSDAAGLRTRATQLAGGGWRLKGKKQYIGNAYRAKQAIVFATVDERTQRFGIRAFLVDTEAPGVTVEPHRQVLGLRCVQLSTINLDDLEVGDERLLHDPRQTRQTDAFEGAQGAWNFMRPCLSAMICGAAHSALEHFLQAASRDPGYQASARVLQLQKDRAAMLGEAVQAVLGLCFRAANEFDHGRPSEILGSAAKALAATVALEVADLMVCTQAMLPDLLEPDWVDRYVRNARAFDILEGTGEMQRLMIARQVGTQRRFTDLAHLQGRFKVKASTVESNTPKPNPRPSVQ